MRISILGAGSWGTALAIILHSNGHDVTLWEYKRSYFKTIKRSRENKIYLPKIKIPKEILITNTLKEGCENQHMIVLAVPSQFIRSVLTKVKKYDLHDATLVSVAKGIEKGVPYKIKKNHISSISRHFKLSIQKNLQGIRCRCCLIRDDKCRWIGQAEHKNH